MEREDFVRAYDEALKLFGRDQVTLKIEEKDMKFKASAGKDFKIVPAGNYVAICNGVFDVGLQPGSDRFPSPKRQVYLRFELPEEQIEYEKDGETVSGPMSIGRLFTASMSEKSYLRPFIESWFGKRFPSDVAAEDFDFALLTGHKCLLNVTHNESGGKTYANVQNATPLPKGMKKDYKQHNKSIIFDLEDPSAMDILDSLPQWLQDKVNNRLDDGKPEVEDTEESEPEFDDDIPF